jgi:hypothetical protein
VFDDLENKFAKLIAEQTQNAITALYLQVVGVEWIKCGQCGEPLKTAEARPKIVSPLDVRELAGEDDYKIDFALVCPKCLGKP